MDNKLVYTVLAVLAALCISASAMSLPTSELKRADIPYQLEEPEVEPDERATWLDTRDIEEEFKELVGLAIEELIKEGRLADITPSGKTTVDKRGRWQGFCFRRTRSGRFLPYICWKGGDARK